MAPRTRASKLAEDEKDSCDELGMDWEAEKGSGTRLVRKSIPFGNGSRTVFSKEGQPPPDPQSSKQAAAQALQDMYRDFDHIYLQVGHRWRTHNYINPFLGYDTWPLLKRNRYHAADVYMENRECLVIAMHSSTFRNAMESFTKEQWGTLFERVRNNKESLR